MIDPAQDHPPPPRDAGQRGLALVMVLWAAIILALMAAGVTRLARGDLDLARNLAEGAQAELAADAALWRAVEALANGGAAAWRADGSVYGWRFAGAELRVAVSDELGRIDINQAPAELLAALFHAAGMDEDAAATVAADVVAYREAEDPTATGEPADAPRRPGASAHPPIFATTDDLGRVPGVTAELMRQIAGAITVYAGTPRPNAAVAGPLARAAISGQTPAAVEPEPPGAGDMDGPAPATLGDAPALLGAAADGLVSHSGLLRVEAEAVSAGGAHFAREAVIAFGRRGRAPVAVRLWQRGARRLFPLAGDAG